jgi:hypothetical protein
MKLELTRAERVVIGQIINIGLNQATLKDHILLEGLYKGLDLENLKMPVATDFVDPDKLELFNQYNEKKISDIEDVEHKKIIQEAMQKTRIEEMKIWTNEEPADAFSLSDTQTDLIKSFFEKDKRPFPREYHKAIIALNEKLYTKK